MNDSQKFCQFCGTPLGPDVKFCEACGQPVASGPVSSSDETLLNLAPMDYTRLGGPPLQSDPEQPPAPPPVEWSPPPVVNTPPPPKLPPYPPYMPPPPPPIQPPKPKRPWWVFALIVGVVVCCLCVAVFVGGYYFFSISSSSRIIQEELPPAVPVQEETLAPVDTVEVTIQVPILEAGPSTPTETPVPEETQALTPPTEAPSISFRGISFSFPPELASAAEGKIVPAVTGGDLPPWEIAPRYARFAFSGYPLQDTFHEPQILIYPVEEYAQLSEGVSTLVGDLRALLATRSTTVPESGLPFLPVWNAAQMLQSYINYIDFGNGSGIRYLTQFGQAAYPIDNTTMFYTFQGLTEDGLYYVAAIFPISNPVLPPADSVDMSGDFFDTFPTYITETEALLDSQPAASFTPDVTVLDQVITSLEVHP